MSSGTTRRIVAVGAAALVVAGLVLATQAVTGTAAAAVTPHGSIGATTQFYGSPNSAVRKWDAANPGDSREPAIASRIGSQPQAVWFSQYSPSTVASDVRAVTSAAATAAQTPVLAVYEIPNRDCGGASAGGAPDIASYKSYIQSFASGLGTHQVVIVLEPDSLALQTCLNAQQISDRDGALAFAAQTLKAADPLAKVYLDAGHSAWNSASDQASRLAAAQITTSADGIFSNASNFMSTGDEVAYDKSVLAALGNPSNLHLVVDTSRNGNGPAPGDPWCDPSGRAVGQAPTANTGDTQVDAYLWIKPPGESDGCADAAGTFDPALAYALATNGGPVTPTTTTTAPPPPPTTTTTPPPPTTTTTGGSGSATCHVTYARQSEWAGGFVANVTVANSGTTAISGWRLTFTFPGDQKVTNAWNATVTQNGTAVTAVNTSSNGTIPAGSSTSLGFQGTWAANDTSPSAFTVNGTACR
jgi:endoglucanase